MDWFVYFVALVSGISLDINHFIYNGVEMTINRKKPSVGGNGSASVKDKSNGKSLDSKISIPLRKMSKSDATGVIKKVINNTFPTQADRTTFLWLLVSDGGLAKAERLIGHLTTKLKGEKDPFA
jgi:hypothetical protein